MGLKSVGIIIRALLMYWLTFAPVNAFGEAGSAGQLPVGTKASERGKLPAIHKASVKSESKPKAKVKHDSRGKPKKKSQTKPQSKLKFSESKAKISKPTVISIDSARFDEKQFDIQVAAARQKVTEKEGNVVAREQLARASVILIDQVLQAEALGNVERARYLIEKLQKNLHDTGWRVQQMALGGDSMAKQAAGFLLMHGVLLSKDSRKSCAEFLAAAKMLAPAAWHAAQCLMESSPDKALERMGHASKKGHAAAQEWMGRRCLGEFGAVVEVENGASCARTYLEQSASQGRASATALLAYLLINGQGGPIDVPRAVKLYKAAAEKGDANAQNNLGELYETGRGIGKEIGTALRWYERAAEAGLGSAQFNAGRLWAVGAGGEKNPAKARVLLTRAEGNGVPQARQVLDWLDQKQTQPNEKAKH